MGRRGKRSANNGPTRYRRQRSAVRWQYPDPPRRRYSPPLRITAVGDPQRLRAGLDASPDIANYKEYVAEYGLGYDVKTLGRVTLPGHTGNLTITYATVPFGADDHS